MNHEGQPNTASVIPGAENQKDLPSNAPQSRDQRPYGLRLRINTTLQEIPDKDNTARRVVDALGEQIPIMQQAQVASSPEQITQQPHHANPDNFPLTPDLPLQTVRQGEVLEPTQEITDVLPGQDTENVLQEGAISSLNTAQSGQPTPPQPNPHN